MRVFLILGLLLAPLVAILVAPHAGDCVVRALLGIVCPGCGLGRALAALAVMDLKQAVACYPALPTLLIAYLVALGAALSPRMLDWKRPAALCGLAATVAVLGSWGLRITLG